MTVVTNAGTAVLWPIFHVHGDGANAFTLTNNSVLDDNGNPLVFEFDPNAIIFALAIPFGDYGILDMFENKFYLASDGEDLAAGIVMPKADFFPLVPGANNITATGGKTIELVRPVTAWA